MIDGDQCEFCSGSGDIKIDIGQLVVPVSPDRARSVDIHVNLFNLLHDAGVPKINLTLSDHLHASHTYNSFTIRLHLTQNLHRSTCQLREHSPKLDRLRVIV